MHAEKLSSSLALLSYKGFFLCIKRDIQKQYQPDMYFTDDREENLSKLELCDCV